MKKYLIIMVCCVGMITSIHAQDYKVAKSTGKLVLNLPSVIVEGYDGNEIIFSSQRTEAEADPRAKGLRAINGLGFIDNTGLGISVAEKGTTVEVNQVASDVGVKIRVPKGLIISFACHKVSNAGKVFFKNMENEIEISTDYNGIELENVTGPVIVRAIYGSVDAHFNEHIKGPISIASIYSTVDVSIPVDTKANVKLSSSHGSILASADLKIEMEKNSESDMISYGGLVNGKLNGGGAEFKLTSEYGKIYLRKSK
jgi:hypothetical protein